MRGDKRRFQRARYFDPLFAWSADASLHWRVAHSGMCSIYPATRACVAGETVELPLTATCATLRQWLDANAGENANTACAFVRLESRASAARPRRPSMLGGKRLLHQFEQITIEDRGMLGETDHPGI